MANNNYSYPRVTLSTIAKKHSHNIANVPDTTIMFAPLVTEKGPDDRLVKIHTLSEFIETFGSFNEDFYNLNGQMALNVYNWLSNGGTLFVKRLRGAGDAKAAKTEGTTTTTKVLYTEIVSNLSLANKMVIDAAKLSTDVKLDLVLNAEQSIGIDASEYTVEDKMDISKVKLTRFYNLDSKDDVVLAKVPNPTEGYTYNDYVIVHLPFESGAYVIPNAWETVASFTVDGKSYVYNATDKVYEYLEESVRKDELSLYEMGEKSGTAYFVFDGKLYTEKESNSESFGNVVFKTKIEEVTNIVNSVQAKYYGEYYNNIRLEATYVGGTTNRVFNFIVYYHDQATNKDIVLEKFLQKTKKNYVAALDKSEYIDINSSAIDSIFNDTQNQQYILEDGLSTIKTYSQTLEAIEEFWEVECSDRTMTDRRERYLVNRLETPIDIIFDAGYPLSIKKAMVTFVRNDLKTSKRTDIVCILDDYILNDKLRLNTPTESLVCARSDSDVALWKATNIAVYEQYFSVLDETFTSQHIHVTPSYFLSKLISYNDLTYGIQYPTAGLRRGILEDAVYVNDNPSPDQKETWFQARVNYVEKSSREYAFMSQRTFDGSTDFDYTALSFLNNERVLERMKKDLEVLGRSYLHEFNDAITIANMTAALNKYVSGWISNRTLSLGVVEVAPNSDSENALDINLNIRFTNTIEVISVSIVIE